jgi:hypothetical protein
VYNTRNNKKRYASNRQYRFIVSNALATAGRLAGSATCATRTEVHAAIQFESVHVEIDLDGSGFFQEFFVDHIFETVDIELFIHFIGLIQSHCQAGAASSAFVQEDPDGLDFLSLKIFSNLFGGRRCYFEHDFLLK